MSEKTMPDQLTITTPAGAELTVYRIRDTKPAYDAASSIPQTMALAAIGYALESLGTDEDGELTEGGRVYRECAMSCGSLYLGNFEGYYFGDYSDLNEDEEPRVYCVRAVDFVQSTSGPRCVLDIWDEDADVSAHYDY